jgi:hypothetical protein
MNSDLPIAFQEGSQAFACDQYYANNFIAFLEANAVYVESPEAIEPAKTITGEKQLSLKLTNESPRLDQESGDALISRFLAADHEIKAQKR